MTPTSENVALPPQDITVGEVYLLLQQVSTKQTLILKEATQLDKRMTQLESNTEDMVTAWKAGGAVLKIMKFSALVGGTFVAVWKLIKGAP